MKRNEKPQAPLVEYMKELNKWDDVMENLPKNKYDELINKKEGEK